MDDLDDFLDLLDCFDFLIDCTWGEVLFFICVVILLVTICVVATKIKERRNSRAWVRRAQTRNLAGLEAENTSTFEEGPQYSRDPIVYNPYQAPSSPIKDSPQYWSGPISY